MRAVTLALSGALIAMPLNAQTTQPAVVTTVAPIAPPTQAVLRSGTPVALRLSEQLTTRDKKSVAGTRFQLQTAEDVVVDGQVVIPSGSPAIGEVTEAKGNGMWGKAGRLTARMVSVRVNGRLIRMTGSFDDKGNSGTGGVVASVLFLPVAGFFVKGRSADIAPGTMVKGYIDEDVPLAFAAAAPAPLNVAAAAAPMTVVATAPAAATALPTVSAATVKTSPVAYAPATAPAAPANVPSSRQQTDQRLEFEKLTQRNGLSAAQAKAVVEKKYGFPMQ